MQDYKSLCEALTIGATLINTQTDDIHVQDTHRQHLISLYEYSPAELIKFLSITQNLNDSPAYTMHFFVFF